MGISVSVCPDRKYLVFLNISFLLVGLVFLIGYSNSSEFLVLRSYNPIRGKSEQGFEGLQSLDDYKAKCLYLKSSKPCVSLGYIDYLYLFYCNFGRIPVLANCLLFLWLLVLFYLLGNTASEYFCSSLESLSRLLKLSPTISGVTLLSLGNGAPDVFASLVSFLGTGTSDIGLNTVIGGASFVTCVVVGIISIVMHRKWVQVNKSAFIRDVCFFLLVVVSVIVILIQGKISLWGAIGFSSMYVVYVIVVYFSHIRWNNGVEDRKRDSNSSNLSVPFLNGIEKAEVNNCIEEGALEDEIRIENEKSCFCLTPSASCGKFLYILEMPLYLPRRLTIPVVCEKRWSKPIAVASVTLAPILLSALWRPHDNVDICKCLLVYGIGLLFGTALGILAYITTEKSSPPRKCLFPWLVGGFFMSVTWTYITAQELVALLVSLGYIFKISPSILGLTVLAWGNSLGDLITNVIMALTGGPEGAQVAISGCFAGPIFNILFGLGLSLVGSCWYNYPSPVVIPRDPYLLETLGFMVGGSVWALLVLPRREMRLDWVFGGGLLAVYLMSMSLRLIQANGSLQLVNTLTLS